MADAHNVAENVLANQDIQLSASYGGSSGGQYSLLSGNYVTQISFLAGTGNYVGLQGITVTFDNGQQTSIGTITSPSATYSVDLSADSIAKLYVKQVANTGYGSSKGIGGVYLETVQGITVCTLETGDTPLTDPSAWTIVAGQDNAPVANIVLLGLVGTSGEAVDSLGFYFKQDVLMSHGMTDVDYTGLHRTDVETPLNVATATVSNQTDQTQQMSISFSESVASTYTFETTAGVSAGLETTVEAGIPFVAKGQVTVSATVSLDVTIGVAKTINDTFAYNSVVTVGPNETIQANAQASSYSLTGSYTANFSEVWIHAGAVTKDVAGTISGVSAYDVTVSYTKLTSA